MQLADHNFVISGGASGLGAACARRFVRHGARVLLLDIQAEAGEALARELGESAMFAQADVADGEQVQRALAAAVARWGELHGAACCAGIVLGMRTVGKQGPHDLAAFEKVIRVNLVGTFNVVRLVAAQIGRQATASQAADLQAAAGEGKPIVERGVLIQTASCAAYEGQIGQAAYSASKAGVAGMTLPLARELAALGIRVVTIAPGTFETPMMGGMTPAVRDSLAAQIPFPPRLGQPDEFAALAQHIVENSMLNGAVIRLDGALRMGPR